LLLVIVILVFAAPFFLLEKWDQRYDSALLNAITAHDVSAARQAFSDGADMSMPFREGGTFLHAVAYHGDVEMAKLLVEHGAARKLQATDSNGDTAEEIAIQNRHSELATYLRSLATTNGAENAK